ncbi:MAG: hypothetical protein SNH63_01065 [Rikenellaceae bacterium]
MNLAYVYDRPSSYRSDMTIDPYNIATKMLSRKIKGADNRFNVNIGDLYGDINVGMNLNLMGESDDKDKMSSGFFIIDSEYRPDERAYDYFESELGVECRVKQEGCYPTISTRYFNRGNYSPFFDLFKFTILDQAANRTYSSMDRFLDFYCDEDLRRSLVWSSYNDDVKYVSTATNELLYHNKMPYGTVGYVATMDDQRTGIDESDRCASMPLEGESLNVGLGYSFDASTNTVQADTSKYNFVIDSTVIHSNPEKCAEFFEMYKESEDFKVYKIEHLKFTPREVSQKEVPDYIVEHFGRIVDTPKRVGTTSRNTIRDQRKRVMVLGGLEAVEREFYSPDYSVVAPPTSGDHRRTLYWNQNVESDAEGRATVTFYNNSQGGSYTIDAQTITAEGQIGSTVP